MTPIPVAVVGCGHLGSFHARAYAADRRCRLEIVVDIVEERAQRLAQELGCAAAIRSDDLGGRVRAATVATPTTTHEEVSLLLLSQGIDVLVEKPLAQDPGSGARIAGAAEAAGRVLAVGHIERYNPAFVLARGDLVAPRFVESHRLATFVARSLDTDVVLDLMIHDIDLVLSVARSPVEAVDAIGVPVLTPEADIANARLRFADGSVANLTASRVSREKMRKIRFFDRNLYVSVDLLARSLERVRLDRAEADDPVPASGDPAAAWLASQGLRLTRETREAPEGDALRAEIGAFLDACAGKPAATVDGRAALRSLEVALQVREAVGASLSRLRLPAK
jgi:predicted dehydrogenase